LFIDLAKANAYEIIDLFYIDNIYARGQTQVADVSLNFKTLPIQIETTQNFVSSVVHRFAENIATSHPSLTDGHACFVFDLCFAALRKTRQSPRRIRIPLQEF
jgi:hypothetical protein